MTIQEITSDPRWSKAGPEQRKRILARATDAPPSLKQIVGATAKQAVTEAALPFRKGTTSRELATDPVTQAKVLPALTAAAGATAPIPFGTSLGTVSGRQLSNAALRAYGHPEEIPSGAQQVLEGALSVAGDFGAIPALNRAPLGRQVGMAERAAGIPEFPKSFPRPTGPGSTARFIDWARGIRGNPGGETLKQIKDNIDFIYKNRKNVPISDIDEGKLKFLGRWVQASLNRLAPGREAAAKNLSRSQIVPRTISRTYKALPKTVRYGLETYGIPAIGAAALFKALGQRDQR